MNIFDFDELIKDHKYFNCLHCIMHKNDFKIFYYANLLEISNIQRIEGDALCGWYKDFPIFVCSILDTGFPLFLRYGFYKKNDFYDKNEHTPEFLEFYNKLQMHEALK